MHPPFPDHPFARRYQRGHLRPSRMIFAGSATALVGVLTAAIMGGALFGGKPSLDPRGSFIRTLAAVAIIVGAVIVVGGFIVRHFNARLDQVNAAIADLAALVREERGGHAQSVPTQRPVVYAGSAPVDSGEAAVGGFVNGIAATLEHLGAPPLDNVRHLPR